MKKFLAFIILSNLFFSPVFAAADSNLPDLPVLPSLEIYTDSVEDALDPQKNVEYGAKFLKNLYEAKGKDWLKAAMAYHSSVPRKALRYKKRLASAYEMVKQANNIDSNAKLFGNTETEKNKKNTSSYAKKDTKAEKLASAKKANQWREAKLAEYRSRKAK